MWHTPAIPTPQKWRQEDLKFKANQPWLHTKFEASFMRLCLKQQQNKNKTKERKRRRPYKPWYGLEWCLPDETQTSSGIWFGDDMHIFHTVSVFSAHNYIKPQTVGEGRRAGSHSSSRVPTTFLLYISMKGQELLKEEHWEADRIQGNPIPKLVAGFHPWSFSFPSPTTWQMAVTSCFFIFLTQSCPDEAGLILFLLLRSTNYILHQNSLGAKRTFNKSETTSWLIESRELHIETFILIKHLIGKHITQARVTATVTAILLFYNPKFNHQELSNPALKDSHGTTLARLL